MKQSSASNHSSEFGRFFRLYRDSIPKDYSVLVGFSGFGNVGYLALTHIVESLDLETVAVWGHTSWFYKSRLESIITVYKHEASKTIIVLPRVPIHVANIPQHYWDDLTTDILQWDCKAYYVIGGLREDTRVPESSDWVSYVPTQKYEKKFGMHRTFGDRLSMIGPLSSFMMIGTSLQKPVLGILVYCNFEEDADASIIALNEIEKLLSLGIELPVKELLQFENGFIPLGPLFSSDKVSVLDELEEFDDDDDDDDDDDFMGYDITDLA